MLRRISLLALLAVLQLGCGDSGAGDASAAGGADVVADPDAGAAADPASDVAAPHQDVAAPDATPDEPAGDAAADTGELPACQPGTRWEPGVSSFVEGTEAWGLLGVTGTRLSVTDLDGDGLPDLIVRDGAGPDDFAAGERHRWLLRNTGDGGFEDVTEASGLLAGRVNEAPGFGRPGDIFASGDVDNDGDLDIYVAHTRTDTTDATSETSELMLNQGDGTFVLGPEDSFARFAAIPAVPAGVTFVDFDGDGALDLWLPQNMPSGANAPLQDRLLRGDGAGGFTDATAATGLSTQGWLSIPSLNAGKGHSWAWSSAACDLNNDGVPELLASSYGRAPNHLWRGGLDDAGGVFYLNESVASGYAYDHRADWTDNINAQCHCFDNPGDAECDTAPAPEGIDCAALKQAFNGSYRWTHSQDREPWRLGGNSGATLCGDIDNDGWVDLWTSEIVHWDVGASSDPAELMINEGSSKVRLARPGNEATGILREHDSELWDHGDMTAALLDFDNDGWTDLYMGSSDYPGNEGKLYHQTAPLQFTLLDHAEAFDHNRSHGVVAADFDRDGDIDLVVGHSRARCGGDMGADCYPTQQVRLFENVLGSAGHWVQLRLVGAGGTNRAAIGTRVDVVAGDLVQTQQVDGGHGHYGTQRDGVLHFGLGDACEATVTVSWAGTGDAAGTFELSASGRYTLTEGDSTPVPW